MSVSEADRRRIMQRCTRLRFPNGAFIFHAGEAGDSLHIIAKGKVAVLAGGRLGDALMVSILGVGDVFGELALVGEDQHRSATTQALEAVETMVLHRSDWEELRRDHASVDRFLIALLARQVSRLTYQLTEIIEVPAPQRVYRRIVALARLYGTEYRGGVIPVTQTQLASMAGVKLRVTNKVIADARNDRLLETGKGRLIVQDPEELRRRARPDR
jgi:CRP-like cAMP-binding protein